jgi:hypothetical protein
VEEVLSLEWFEWPGERIGDGLTETRIVDIDRRLEERFAPAGVGEIALVRDSRMSVMRILVRRHDSGRMRGAAYRLKYCLAHRAC